MNIRTGNRIAKALVLSVIAMCWFLGTYLWVDVFVLRDYGIGYFEWYQITSFFDVVSYFIILSTSSIWYTAPISVVTYYGFIYICNFIDKSGHKTIKQYLEERRKH